MATYKIDIDDFCDGVFHKLERISDGGGSHKCFIKDCTDKVEAAHFIAGRLVGFIEDQLIEFDEEK